MLTTGDASHLAEYLPPMPKTGHAVYWSSVSVWAQALQSADLSKAWDASHLVETPSRDSWHGASVAETYSLARDGWSEGADRVATLRDRVNAESPVQRRYARYGVAGAIPNVPRYLAGNPQHMLRLDNAAARQRPVITIVSELGISAFVDSQALMRRAAVCAAIVDAIENAGFSCHVIGTVEMKNDSFIARAAVSIKEASSPVDISRLAFSIGHSAVTRRMTWGIFGLLPEFKKVTKCMGYPFKANFDGMAAKHVYYLPKLGNSRQVAEYDCMHESDFESDDAAISRGLPAMVERMRAQGCPAFPDDAMAA